MALSSYWPFKNGNEHSDLLYNFKAYKMFKFIGVGTPLGCTLNLANNFLFSFLILI